MRRAWALTIVTASILLIQSSIIIVNVADAAEVGIDMAGSSKEKLPANLISVLDKMQSFGTDRYPIGFWNYTDLGRPDQAAHMNKAAVKDWADVGFTVPMSPEFDANDPKQVSRISDLLDWCNAQKIKMIVCDPRTRAKRGEDMKHAAPDYRKNVTEAIKDFGSRPALFGFHIGDEPDNDMISAFSDCSRILKDASPKLHPFGNLFPVMQVSSKVLCDKAPERYLQDYIKASNTDLVCYDCYTQMLTAQRGSNTQYGEQGIGNYYENLRVFRSASLGSGVPFWTTLLCIGHLTYRCPTLDDIRWQFNTSVCYGANGILWFFYYMREPNANYRQGPVDEFWHNTQGHYNLSLVHNYFHRTYGDLFTRIVSTKVMFYGKVYGQGRAFEPDSLVSSVRTDLPDHPVLIGEFADAQGYRYVMIVNNSQTTDASITVTFPGEDVKVYTWDWYNKLHEGNAFSAIAGRRDKTGYTIEHWLAPGQEAVYRVDSSLVAKERIVFE